jgi:dedicated sortase system histidine kinase
MFAIGLSVRAKVLLASAVLLVIPYVGYRYVQETENFLRDGLETSVLGAAQALAGALHDRVDLLEDYAYAEGDEIFVHPLAHAMQMDGYARDWSEYRENLRPLAYGDPGDPLSARYLAGRHAGYLYVLIEVSDPKVRYRRPEYPDPVPGDQVDIRLGETAGSPRRYRLSPISPGWVTVYQVSGSRITLPLRRREPRIWAQWQPVSTGYTVELRVPLALAGQRMAIDVRDVAPGRTAEAPRVSTTSGGPRALPGRLVFPSAAIAGIIQSLGRTPGRRVRVVDPKGRVLAAGGSLANQLPPTPINPLFALLLAPPSAELFQEEQISGQLSGPEIDAALKGRREARWNSTANPDVYVVSAAHPVWIGEKVAGAVVVEETSLSIQTVRRQALADLFTKTLMVFTGAGLLLFLFANRISLRLRRLRDEAEQAIDEHGRVVGQISHAGARDEIGDLGRSFSTLTERLRQYNHYLEQLARRLSHELRTPLAVIRSSLDSLAMGEEHPDGQKYLLRAREGVGRLETIIVRMSEAARLEEALQSAELERFDLDAVLAASVEGYRQTWPDSPIEYTGPGKPSLILGVPDLLVQMLDKLVGNARDFTIPGHAIRVRLAPENARLILSVANDGPLLPDEMSAKLFESMVSLRISRTGEEPHLGLGLYIVRLIAEFHDGDVSAGNMPSGTGVVISVSLPGVGPAGGRDSVGNSGANLRSKTNLNQLH